jgi:hypothetical protein
MFRAEQIQPVSSFKTLILCDIVLMKVQCSAQQLYSIAFGDVITELCREVNFMETSYV